MIFYQNVEKGHGSRERGMVLEKKGMVKVARGKAIKVSIIPPIALYADSRTVIFTSKDSWL